VQARRIVSGKLAAACAVGLAGAVGIACAVGVALAPVGTAAPDADAAAYDAAHLDRFDTVVVDAGHGGEDEGAKGANGLLEKELVLDVARGLAARLRSAGLRVVMTREKDVFVPLEARTNIANDARGDLFVSIHANAARRGDARGSETYFMSLEASDEHARGVALRENEAFALKTGGARADADPLVAILGDLIANEHLTESSDFARAAQLRLAALDASASRGVKQAPFVVLAGVQMPAALVEIGFVTHAAEARELRSARRRAAIAAALAEAVLEHGRRHDAQRGMLPAAGAEP
jgi:N-acetylmuramoyl-L-alanine amidase